MTLEPKEFVVLGHHYMVFPDGTIINGKGKPFRKHLSKDGYEYIGVSYKNIHGEKKIRKERVHRIVATLFIDNPLSLPQVNHKDGNKTNNDVSNLEWVTNSGNQTHSRYVLGNTTGFKDTPVICVETGERFVSTRDAWRKTGINYCHISECARGKRQSAGGLHWTQEEGDQNHTSRRHHKNKWSRNTAR